MKSSFNGFIRSLAALALVISFSSAALADGVNVEWFTESVTQVGKALTAAGQSGASGASDYGTWTAQGTSAKLAEVLATDLEASPNKICVDTCETADGISLKYQPSTVLTDDKAIMYLNGVCFQNISALNDDDLEDAKAAVAIVKVGDAYKFAVAGYDSDESKVKWMTTEVTANRATSYDIKVEIDYENHTVTYYNGSTKIASKVLKSDAAKVASATVTGFGEFTGFLGEYVGAYEAMLGKVPYATFGAAYAVATSGVNTIALLKNVEWAPTYSTDLFKSVTVSNGNYSLTLAATSVTAYNEKGYLCKLDGSTLKLGLPFGGAGTEASPYTVGDAETFKLFANGVTACSYGKTGEFFKQTASFALCGADEEFDGVGKMAKSSYNVESDVEAATFAALSFIGTYDGNNKTISNVVLSKMVGSSEHEYGGLFNSVYNGTIKNLNVSIGGNGGYLSASSGSSYGGGVCVGFMRKSTVENVNTIVDGDHDTFITTHATGGIVGFAARGSVIQNCTNNLNISTSTSKAGGIVCINQGEKGGDITAISGCENNGNITYVDGKADGNGGFGGIVGYVAQSLTIADCSVNKNFTITKTGSGADAAIGAFVGIINNGYVVTCSGVNTAPAGMLSFASRGYESPYSGSAVNMNFATVDDGVATYVDDDDVVAAGEGETTPSYLVTAPLDSYTFNFSEPGTITFDRTLYTAFTPTIGKTRGGLRITEPAAGWTTGTWTAWNAPTVLIFN